MELLFCIAVIFILRDYIKKVLKLAFGFIFLPIIAFIIAIFTKFTFYTAIVAIIVVYLTMRELSHRQKHLFKTMVTSKRKYECGMIEKMVNILMDLNFIVFIVFVPVLVIGELVSTCPVISPLEILILVFIVPRLFRVLEKLLRYSLKHRESECN